MKLDYHTSDLSKEQFNKMLESEILPSHTGARRIEIDTTSRTKVKSE